MNTIAIFAAATLAGAVVQVNALQYQIGSGSTVAANSVDPGLKIKTEISSAFAGNSFSLDDSQSVTLNFFKIWADEGSVESDDLTPKPITATIDFASPNENATIGGVTLGATINLLYDKAILTWAGPLTLSLSDRTFSVTLSDVEFSKGSLFDVDLGGHSTGKWVTATVRQVSHNVPDGGATAALLGLGVAALSLVRRGKS